MFKTRDHDEFGTGPRDGGPMPRAAALVMAQVLPDPVNPLQRLRECALLRLDAWRLAIEGRCLAMDLAPDLAEDIGSARWFRGFGTMLGLSLAAASFWPDFSAVEAATATPAQGAVRDEFRSQMIMPLALGGDSGRRMGATSAVVPLRNVPERPTVRLVATLVQGDSFARMLERAGVGPGDADRVAALVSAAVPLGEITPGTQFDITLGRRATPDGPRPLDGLAFRARFDLDLAVSREKGALALARKQIAVDATPLRITGIVGASLYRSARAAGAPLKAIQQYLQVLDQHVSLENDLAPGDRFDIVLAYRRSARGESLPGELLYAGLETSGRAKLQLMRWGKDGQFFEASGIGTQRSTQFAPVAGRITSGFGARRHPILGYTRMHAGVDFGARYGAPIFAVSSGVVAFAGRHGGHGKYVRISHGGGNATGYAHMSEIAVSAGTPVHAGQVIGYVGSTGLSTGPHLHFEVYRGGQAVNPLSVSFTTRAEVDKKELAAFKARLAQLKAVTPGAALGTIAPQQAQARTPAREIAPLGE